MRSIVLALFLAFPAHAGVTEELEILGFSADGAYFAFRAFDEGEMGHASSRVGVVDVKKNAFIGKPFSFEAPSEKTTAQSAREQVLALAGSTLKRLGIDSKTPGTAVIAARLEVKHQTPIVRGWGGPGGEFEVTVREHPYQLSLKELQAVCPQDGGDGIYEPKLLEVVVKNTKTKGTRVLQKDSELPVKRGCAMGYRLGRVILGPGSAVVVLLRVSKPGYEGASLEWMPVTGELP
jgi:predicted secreted protein